MKTDSYITGRFVTTGPSTREGSKMKKSEMLARADAVFERTLMNPTDPNARIIMAKQDNLADRFKPAKLIRRADLCAHKRARQAEKALSSETITDK